MVVVVVGVIYIRYRLEMQIKYTHILYIETNCNQRELIDGDMDEVGHIIIIRLLLLFFFWIYSGCGAVVVVRFRWRLEKETRKKKKERKTEESGVS